MPHRQVVFTIPKRLRIYFRFDRKLLGELPSCAWRALQLYFAACFEREVVVPGAIGFVQTAGELLGWHPHLHLLLTDGGWLPDGRFRHLLAFDSSAVEKLFRAEVLRLLVARGKISGEVVANLFSWRHSGFSVHAGAASNPAPRRSVSAATASAVSSYSSGWLGTKPPAGPSIGPAPGAATDGVSRSLAGTS